jgi:hypothetical protein
MLPDSKVWKRLIEHSWNELDPRSARVVLKLRFADHDRQRVDRLIRRSQDDVLSPAEREELDAYLLKLSGHHAASN